MKKIEQILKRFGFSANESWVYIAALELGTASAQDIAKKAAEYGMPAVALTDNGNMFAAAEFYFVDRLLSTGEESIVAGNLASMRPRDWIERGSFYRRPGKSGNGK